MSKASANGYQPWKRELTFFSFTRFLRLGRPLRGSRESLTASSLWSKASAERINDAPAMSLFQRFGKEPIVGENPKGKKEIWEPGEPLIKG